MATIGRHVAVVDLPNGWRFAGFVGWVSGLGLHLVRLVVEHAGGQIWCESEEGQGSRFTFTLPAVQQEGVQA